MTAPPLASTAPPLDLLIDASPRVSSLFLAIPPRNLSHLPSLFTPDATQSIAPLVAGCFLHIMESCGQSPDALPSIDLEHAAALTSSTAAKFKWLAAGGDAAVAIKMPFATDLQQQERGGDVEEEEEEI